MKKDHLIIRVDSPYGIIELEIWPNSAADDLFQIDESNNESLEAPYQLKEGCRYHYEFYDKRFQFKAENMSAIIQPSKSPRHLNEGIINTGVYVGTLSLEIVMREDPAVKVAEVDFEVLSVKMDYRRDYQYMLEDITNNYVDLLMMPGSPVNQYFEVDLNNCDTQTLYQRFSFLKSIIDSEDFNMALNKIFHNPVKGWTDIYSQRKITGLRRLSRQSLRQIASKPNRDGIDPRHYGLPEVINSLPQTIEVPHKRDTVNVIENQFIKFVLIQFQQFCNTLAQLDNSNKRLKAEASQTENLLNRYLSSAFFREISSLTFLNCNSPVLQKREGYREIMQAWLFFDMAAKLTWKGGDNIYKAGKKNVAALYEYWVFFQLMKVISDYFKIEPESLSSLVRKDESGVNLELCQGKTQVVKGVYQNPYRNLKVEFYYNKTFNSNTDPESQGSWSIQMRPDYTLAIWPEDLELSEAERENLVIYIHFDAKYRLRELIFGDKSAEQLNQEKDEESQAIFRQGDILKMHAYKDAIRRSAGAYVIYPGDIPKEFHGYHEVIPGLGAFIMRPGDSTSSEKLLEFIEDVVKNLLNRSSMRERMATHEYMVFEAEKEDKRVLRKNLPEALARTRNRNFIPDETNVLLAYCKSEKHLEWIMSRNSYNYRLGTRRGAINISGRMADAKYILLHDGKKSLGFYKLLKKGPKVLSTKDLKNMDYPYRENHEQPRDEDIYLIYEFRKAEKNFSVYQWKMENFKELTGKNVSRMHIISLTDLMLNAQ